MSDALPRSITLIGRLKKEWSRISRDIYSESYTSRQEIVRFTPRLDRGSNQCGVYVKEKPPLPGALISNGAAYRIRTYDVLIRSQTLYPAEVTPQRTNYYAREPPMGQATIRKKFYGVIIKLFVPRPRFESMRCCHKRKAPVAGGFQFQLVRRIGFEPMTF